MESSAGATDAVRVASGDVLGQLDRQDFDILKVLEVKGALDAAQVAGTARLRATNVLEALKKLEGLDLVTVEPDQRVSSPYEERFALNSERLTAVQE
jgi:DNA-binding MarR family transcriptional regulator